jgi:hypothetical protein
MDGLTSVHSTSYLVFMLIKLKYQNKFGDNEYYSQGLHFKNTY